MSDNPINPSIVALLTLSLEKLTRQMEAREAYDGELMRRLEDATRDLLDQITEAGIREWDAEMEGAA